LPVRGFWFGFDRKSAGLKQLAPCVRRKKESVKIKRFTADRGGCGQPVVDALRHIPTMHRVRGDCQAPASGIGLSGPGKADMPAMPAM
jgi:hypothetical protein